jgi:hypothetical protein
MSTGSAAAAAPEKSTLARRLASMQGLYVYATAAAMRDHAGRLLPEFAPYPTNFRTMDMDER